MVTRQKNQSNNLHHFLHKNEKFRLVFVVSGIFTKNPLLKILLCPKTSSQKCSKLLLEEDQDAC